MVADIEDKTGSLLVSARTRYAFADPSTVESAWVPFVAAGVSRAVSITNGFNVGGGVEYWGRDAYALRLETLVHLFADSERYLEFRAGLAFRRAPRRRP